MAPLVIANKGIAIAGHELGSVGYQPHVVADVVEEDNHPLGLLGWVSIGRQLYLGLALG